MSDWKARRFWTETTVVDCEGGFTVELDGRPVRSPAKSPLILPSREMAQASAAEWHAQDGEVDPLTMPVTRAANAAIDKVAVQRQEVISMIAEYGDSDLTCYRASQPGELAARQARSWDPLLDWAAENFGARLIPVQGVVHVAQRPEMLQLLAEPLRCMTPFELTAMHDLIGLSGSLIIGLAASEKAFPLGFLWKSSRIDEDWQVEQWGEDDEASALAETKRTAFFNAARFIDLARA